LLFDGHLRDLGQDLGDGHLLHDLDRRRRIDEQHLLDEAPLSRRFVIAVI
jgi:hypothetical protein